jgi:hypothetical protein
MQLRACISGFLLASAGCAHLPEPVTIDVDGRLVELRQPGKRSASPECATPAPTVEPADVPRKIVLVGPDHVLVAGKGGKMWSLHRCRP